MEALQRGDEKAGRRWRMAAVVLLLVMVCGACSGQRQDGRVSEPDSDEESELMKYLTDVKFDAELHRETMRKEIYTGGCPTEREGIKIVADREQ